MASSVAPYEQLVRQVEALKAENSHLRQELRDNSSHLSKLETETSGMKVRRGWAEVGGTDTRRLAGQAGHLLVGLAQGSPGSRLTCWRTLPPPPQEVLKHLQGKLEQEAGVLVSLGQTDVLEQLKGEGPAGGGGLCTLGQSPALLQRELGEGGGGARRGTELSLSSVSIQPCRWTSPACTTSSSNPRP